MSSDSSDDSNAQAPSSNVQLNKIDDHIEQIDIIFKRTKLINNNLYKAKLKCTDKFAILKLIIMQGLKTSITSVAPYLTKMEYVFYLVRVCHHLNIQKTIKADNSIFNKCKLEYYGVNYSSTIFQKIIEETMESDNSIKFNTVMFIFNYYLHYHKHNKASTMLEKIAEFENYLCRILKFEDTFLNVHKDACHIYVFNIVLGVGSKVPQYINTKIYVKYIQRIDEYYKVALKHMNYLREKKNYNFPKWFIIKHDNEVINKATKTIYGETLENHKWFDTKKIV